MPHYDTHEVFVLQIAGKKHWRVYEPPLELPHRKQPFNPIGYSLPAKPLLEIDLEPGDLLYLPRGHVHTTTTSNGNCAHITIGMAVYTWIDLAGELLQSAMTLPRFRTALPPGFGQAGSRDVLRAELAAVLDDLCKTASANQLIDAFLTRLQATRTTDREGFRADVIVIQPDTLLQSPEPSEYRFVAVGTKVAVEFQHRRFILQGESQATLEGMRKLHVFRAIDLPGPLPMDAKLTLVRTLFDKGFLSTP
jgi:ribosomal protein L16 Arg81 hydroxylase